MAGYATGVPELVNAAKDIVETDERVQGILRALRSTVDGLAGAWQGNAAVAFNNLINRFDEDAQKLQQALRDIAEQMSGTADIYQRQEEEQSQSMSGIAGRLGG